MNQQDRRFRRILPGILVAALLGSNPTGVAAQTAPSVMVQANAPGWITIAWEHSGQGAAYYLVQRQEPAFTWTFVINTHSHTDRNLKAGTTYNYRVCAVDANDKGTCSPWIGATTMPPESAGSYAVPVITGQSADPDRIRISWTSATRYGSFNVRWSEKGTPAGQENVRGNGTSGSFEVRGLQPGRTFAFLVQGCNWGLLGSGCSGWTGVDVTTPLPPPPLPTAPVLTASASSPSQIVLSWPVAEAERITRTVIERDGRPHVERGSALSRFDDAVRPNTEYGYRVCLTNQTGTACSPVVTAMAQAVAPTPLANVTFTRSAHSGAPGGGVSRASARITRVLKADWRNGGTPGQFVTLEREDRGPVDHIRVGKTWTEVKRISAKADPTEIWIEIGSASPQIGVRDGTNYRVCTIVPPLGPAGKVCSAPSAPNEQ